MNKPYPPKFTILLVDDHWMVRTGLRLLIENQPGLEVVGEAGNCEETLSLVADLQPDLVVLDLDLKGQLALDILPKLNAASRNSRVLVLTGLRDPKLYLQAIGMGVKGLVLKDHAKECLVEALDKIRAGESWYDNTVIQGVLSQIQSGNINSRQDKTEADKISSLTKREREIISLINKGLKNRQIADMLHISEGTVRNHLTVIYQKLDVTDRFGLILYSNRHNLHGNQP